MKDQLTERLNRILPKLISDELLSGSGLGNEIGFYVFDYSAEDELRVREHIQFLLDHLPKSKPGLRVKHVNLFDLVIDHLKSRNLLDRAIQMQRTQGDKTVFKALRAPLHESRLAQVFADAAQPSQHDLVLVSGVGSVWPLLRSHALLNNLHPVMGNTPLVMFYPGKYDQLTVQLFGIVESRNYYRAFKLVP
ncbi:MAG: DUF1788 domain-containing protein [Verrucomicrobia bacterium]|jgi:hypothetical protein|nr:DUF1788 domain-containing protein [Verrucomicrobiota bacterium]OQC65001.1 MAG: hypothetical protein BWX48_02685 [Verrucomicrobia bacterium ADurb.Bin006]HOI36888.1 DUF1788 domain-containing protein [Bacillota bacterium]MDI9381101.1 DUF1788 domain-containing protein [Verrucomicrobiota bacterium]NMD20947.1 DUF1788 domain-containing protein [Verrucomicrobiota bacterium]